LKQRGVAQPGISSLPPAAPIHRDGNLFGPHRAECAKSTGAGHFVFAALVRKTLFAPNAAPDLLQDRGIIDRRRHSPRLAVRNLLHSAAQDIFPEPRLRQPRDRNRELEGRNWTDFFLAPRVRRIPARSLPRGRSTPALSTMKAAGDPRPLRGSATPITAHSADILVRGEHLLHCTGREAGGRRR